MAPDGKKIAYYQVNATFFSALGEDERKLLLARAIQMFMPGIPQVWYLDLFAGKNDYAAADNAGTAGHKEINRTTLTIDDIEAGLGAKSRAGSTGDHAPAQHLAGVQGRTVDRAHRGASAAADLEAWRVRARRWMPI